MVNAIRFNGSETALETVLFLIRSAESARRSGDPRADGFREMAERIAVNDLPESPEVEAARKVAQGWAA